jgi:hypothetical protein
VAVVAVVAVAVVCMLAADHDDRRMLQSCVCLLQ